MSVESEPLRLLPHSITFAADGRWVLKKFTGETIGLPTRFQSFIQLASAGHSLAQMAQAVRTSGGLGRFANLVQFLYFLYDHDLLADRRAIELAEALRPETIWPRSLASASLGQTPLIELHGKRNYVLSVCLTSLIVISALVGLISYPVILARLSVASLVDLYSGWAFIAIFFIAASLSRSVRNALRAFALAMGWGLDQRLSLLIDPLSASLAADDLSRMRLTWQMMVTCFASIPLPFLAPLLMKAFGGSFTMVSVSVGLFMLVDLSPFSKSTWTDALRAFFNYVDRLNERSNRFASRDAGQEQLVHTTHVLSIAVWLLLALFVLIKGAVPLVMQVVRVTVWSDWASASGTLALAALIVFLLIAWLDEAASSLIIGGSENKRRFRRLWRIKSASSLASVSGLADGEMPSRADLEKLPLFSQIEVSARVRLLEKARVANFSPGELICRQGDQDRDLFVVLSGRLAVARRPDQRHATRRRVVAMLEPGAAFGEAAFFFAKPRTADVVALEPSRVLRVPHSEAMKTANAAYSEELQTRIWLMQALVASSFFKDLPTEALNSLMAVGVRQTVKAGAKVITEGEAGDACYFLVQGKATVVQNMRVINQLQTGDMFGEISLLQPQLLRTATVVASSDLILIRLDNERFWTLLSMHLPLAVEIEALAEQRLANDHSSITRR